MWIEKTSITSNSIFMRRYTDSVRRISDGDSREFQKAEWKFFCCGFKGENWNFKVELKFIEIFFKIDWLKFKPRGSTLESY